MPRKNREGKRALVLALASPPAAANEPAALAGFDAIHLRPLRVGRCVA
jgi:hypothetical protein